MTAEVAKPKQKLIVIDEYCTHAQGSDCMRCSACCPKDAITLFEEPSLPQVNHDLCNGCGICFGVCDAFASTRMNNFDLHARIRRIAASGQRAYLTCKENVFPGFEPDTNVVVLPCLSMMSPEMWTLVLAEGIRVTIACDLKYCEGCEKGGEIGGELFGHSIQIAEERTGAKTLFTYRIPEKKKLLDKYAENEPAGRREVFSTLAADAAGIASGNRRLRNSKVLQDFYVRRERQRAIARLNLADDNPLAHLKPDGRNIRMMFPKQQLLVEAVETLPGMAPQIEVAVSVTDKTLCCGAGKCASSCPTGARYVDNGKALVEATLCIGCGICVDACDYGACSVEDATALIYLDTEARARVKASMDAQTSSDAGQKYPQPKRDTP